MFVFEVSASAMICASLTADAKDLVILCFHISSDSSWFFFPIIFDMFLKSYVVDLN